MVVPVYPTYFQAKQSISNVFIFHVTVYMYII